MPITWTKRPEANRLLEESPLALLIGLVLDQQVTMEKAFDGPYELSQRLGDLDAVRIAAMDPAELEEVFARRPALHRFPRSMASRVQQLCRALVDDHGGDAAAVWRGVESGADLAARLRRLPGFGEQKVRITVAVLGKKFGVQPPGWEAEAAGWHSIADVESEAGMLEAREVKRQMKAAARKP